MIKKTLNFVLLSVFILGVFLPLGELKSQELDESFRIKIESILYRFKNYRFGTISVFELKDPGDLRKAIQTKEKKQAGSGAEGEEILKDVPKTTLSLIERGVKEGKTSSRIARDFIGRGEPLPPNFEPIVDYYKGQLIGKQKVLRKGYMITTRVTKDDVVPEVIIGLIAIFDDQDNLKKNIDRPSPQNVFTYDEMKQFDLERDEFSAENLYDLMMTAFRQNNVKNITTQAQGIGEFLRWAPKKFGVSKSLVKNEIDVSSQDIQNFMRISEGMPTDYFEKTNEVIISPDLISWRKYDMGIVQYEDGFIDTLNRVTNNDLPTFGVEVRYGIDEINYPSLWSERMSVNAIWQNVKLGVVLPTSGWASLSDDLFSQERMLTNAGVGINGSVDFPIKVVPRSGVFHLSGSYVFGDAEEAGYKDRGLNAENFDQVFNHPHYPTYFKYDYLIRGNAQLHYTFGVAIDEDYLMRFGIGATMYNVETWSFRKDSSDPIRNTLDYYKKDDETIGGISGRLEFMSKNVVTPYGASIQYFDESLMADIWLQIPVIENTFAIRLDAKGYFAAFRDDEHEWEHSSLFTPMARFIVIF